MNRDLGTKLFMEAFESYVHDNRIELNDSNMNDVLQKFIVIYNKDREKIINGEKSKSLEEKIADLLDEAAMSENAKKARSYVKKALKLNPDHIGAQLFLIDLEDSQIDKIGKLLELQAREKQRVDYFQREMGEEWDNYYLNIEGRDYLHILFDLCQTYIKCGMYNKALSVAIEAIHLDDLDHASFHNDVISILLYLEQFEEAEVWLNGYQVETPTKLLFDIVYNYKLGDLELAQDKVEQLSKEYPMIRKLMLQIKISERSIEKMLMSEQSQYIHEFMDVLRSSAYLFAENTMFDWIIDQMRKFKKTPNNKKGNILLN